jgi:hypothetical protein
MSKLPLRKERYGHGLTSDDTEALAEGAGVTSRQAEATIIEFLVPLLDGHLEMAWEDAITNAQNRAVGEAELKADLGHKEISPAAWEAQ